ncbi:hypothetical protein J4G02_03860 [Candidatus Poribacteria bacterium]|nr:hypothetical protein [Candidatus Poribacteria bacterium]
MNGNTNYTFKLSLEHLAAANRKRRIVVNHQVDGLLCAVEQGLTVDKIMAYEFAFADAPGVHIDAQWWSFDNTFPLEGRPLINETSPSVPKYVSLERVKIFEQWLDDGVNIAEVYIEETKKRGLECFYTYRLNEDPYTEHRELAEAHPDWLIAGEWAQPLWNFAVPGVRDYKVAICRELVEGYNFDGLEIDFARGPIQTPPGHQWEQREHITEFLRRVRQETLEVERKRGRPVLLAARIPDNLIGCHFDGLDVETWVCDDLVDFLVLGVRSYELAIEQFRSIVGDKPIQIFGTLDDHHCTDGYSWPPIEVWRGVIANWWQQGVDAIQTFNWGVAPPEVAQQLGVKTHGAYFDGTRMIPVYQQAYGELGDPEKLKYLNKHFVVQRRGGGGSGGADVEEWHTPRFSYQNTNMLGQLPMTLDNLGLVDALIRLRVSDDFTAEAERIERLALRLLFSDPGTENLPEHQKIDTAPINPFWDRPQLFTSPARKDIIDRLQVRLNGVLLDRATVDAGWFIFDVNPKLFAVGINLVGILVTGQDSQRVPMTVEKVEAHVEYRRP